MEKKELYQLDLNQIRKIVGLFSNDALPVVSERTPTLSEMTQKALEVLKKDKDGFFLMVEGSQIDWRGHENAGQQLIEETIEFDNAITAGIEVASKIRGLLLWLQLITRQEGAQLSTGLYQNTRLKWLLAPQRIPQLWCQCLPADQAPMSFKELSTTLL